MDSVLFENAQAIFRAALEAVRPETLIVDAFDKHTMLQNAVERAGRIIVVGGGKAGGPMAVGLESALAPHLDRVFGMVNVPTEAMRPTSRITQVPARTTGSNIATQIACDSATKMLGFVENATLNDVVVCLLSGGGSALLPVPAPGVSLNNKIAATELLSKAGATIHELNCVRKHLSLIKGGQLAARCQACELWSLIISDVVDDQIDVIASGPTAADSTTFQEAIGVLARYGLRERVPVTVSEYLNAGSNGRRPETPKAIPPSVHNLILANNLTATFAAAIEATRLGYAVETLNRVTVEATVVAHQLADRIRSIKSNRTDRFCLVVGGETTVSLPACHGTGGRNQELALAVAEALGVDDLNGVGILCVSTDGEDGPTDAAGAYVDQKLSQKALRIGFDASQFLLQHDSYRFFERVGGLIRTGLTGTNVADIAVVLVHCGP